MFEFRETVVVLPLLVLFNLSGCSAVSSSQDASAPKHLLPWAVTDRMLLDFTIEEEKSILESFKVVIPEDESAHVHSFYYESEKNRLDFVLEIEGVSDYEAFFAANTLRIHENGLKGKSWNEIHDCYPPEYYLTYYESFYSNPDYQSDEDKEMISALKSLYDEIYESKNNQTSSQYLVCLTVEF